MKYCPQCQTTYTDDLLKYCLKDGTPLGEVFAPAGDRSGKQSDAGSIRQVEPIRVPVERDAPAPNVPVQTTPPPNQLPNDAPLNRMQPEAARRKTGFIVAMTVLATVLLLGLGGIAALLYTRNQKTEVAAANVNKTPVNRQANAAAANASAANLNANQNANQNANANVVVAASPTATAKPAIDREQAEEVSAEVGDAIDEWKNATENLDIGGQLSQYAETIDYYRSGRVNRAAVRADKDRAFSIYDKVNIDISNLKITPGNSGENATAVFDKEWDFEGAADNSSGKVQQQLTLSKVGGRWLITGERDLKVYYVNK